MADTKRVLCEHLRSAARLATTAIEDLARGDRIDALDSIHFSIRNLERVRMSIEETLPEEVYS